ncbi:septum formation inhibitor Maf [Marinobacterium sp. AK62]|uniref:dTTP/UTP pyrophosphatase n=1 Tax=Marinobacterium alkalitolerans TaxID=1542925 RepID=A0ABS3ZAT3_9GAMM|nr:Maf family protein [Marinobacterium alkalitolerans]MBP0048805.1 septum formation inhibitor Maf [Marinobacterium alkalitolerans]
MSSLILASASPRRRELLEQIGVAFTSVPVDIDETPAPNEPAAEYVARLALEKARACQQLRGEGPVYLGSDTTVTLDGHILGKPADEEGAVSMLMHLSGRQHQVMTSVALVQGAHEAVETVVTDVSFRALDEAICRRYWHTGEPQDKAGAYGIQGMGAVFVSRMEGSYSAVVGLPLMETAQLLESFGVPVWHAPAT